MATGLTRLFFVLTAVGFAGLPAADAKTKWLQASTEDVRIISDAPARAITEYAVKYSAYRQAFTKLFAPVGRSPPPVVILLFQSQAELAEYIGKGKEPGYNLTTFSAEVDRDELLAIADTHSREDTLSFTVEFDTIWSLRRVGYFLPLWAGQGAGQVLASLRIKNGRCLVDGNLDRASSNWVNQQSVPWKRFFEISESSPEYTGPRSTGAYQAQAWALMNLILMPGGKPGARLETLAHVLQKGGTGPQVVEEVTGLPLADIDRAIEHQLRNDQEIAVPFDEKAIIARLKIEPADEVEVSMRLSDLLVANNRIPEADLMIDRAAVLTPQAAAVNEALARQALRANDSEEAVRYYRKAMEAGSVNVSAWLTSANQHLNDSAGYGHDVEGGGRKGTEAALEEIHRAIELDPGDMRARQMLGRAYYVREKPTVEGVAELSQAVTEDKEGVMVRYYRAQLFHRLGRLPEAIADLDRVIANQQIDSGLRATAQWLKMDLQFKDDQPRVDQFVRETRYDEARGLIKRRLEALGEVRGGNSYRQLLAWVEENATWAGIVDLYQAKNWLGVIKAAEKFQTDFPSSPRRQDAAQLIEDATANAAASPH